MLICRERVVQLHGEFRIPTLLKQLTAFAVAKSRLAAISRNEMVHFHVLRSLETSVFEAQASRGVVSAGTVFKPRC